VKQEEEGRIPVEIHSISSASVARVLIRAASRLYSNPRTRRSSYC